MTNHILILGGTGKTGSRLARALRAANAPVRTAARSGADAVFDWDAPDTHAAALTGVDRVYLVPPPLRVDAASLVAGFLDRAVDAGVRHVTLLSAHGVEHAPPEAMLRAIELDVLSRNGLTHSILRPAWFMQNLSEGFLEPGITTDGVIAIPVGDGAEAYVDVEDVAAVAAATLTEPDRHAGAQYRVTGPEALTAAQLAERIGAATGRELRHLDLSEADWLREAVQAGIPVPYAELLASLLAVIRSGEGARPGRDVLDVTGSAPRGFDRFAADAVAAGAWTPPARAASASYG